MQTATPTEIKPRAPRRIAPATADVHPAALLRIGQIIGTPQTPGLLNIGRSRFYELVKEGVIPCPVKLGHSSFWRAADVIAAIRRLGGE